MAALSNHTAFKAYKHIAFKAYKHSLWAVFFTDFQHNMYLWFKTQKHLPLP